MTARERKVLGMLAAAKLEGTNALRWLAEKYVDEQTKMTRATNKAVRDLTKQHRAARIAAHKEA